MKSPILKLSCLKALAVTVVSLLLFGIAGGATIAQEPPTIENQVSGETITVEPAGTGSWQEMLDYEATHPAAPTAPKVFPEMSFEPRDLTVGPASLAPNPSFPMPNAPSAPPTLQANFAGLGDNNTAIPPDTMGAAGPNHLMIMLNTQVRIQSKTGTNLSTVSLNNFWTSVSGFTGNSYDPRLIYDPLSGRWMAIVDVDPQVLATSRVWFAISSTSDPTGTWTFYEIDADTTNTYWADFPDIGTNNTWIAITNNMYDTSSPTNIFNGAAMWVIDKSTALAGGALTMTTFTAGFDAAGGGYGFALRPALTFDAGEGTLYIADNTGFASGGIYLLRLSRITGTAAVPVWSVVPNSAWAGSGWFQVINNFQYAQDDCPQLGTGVLVNTNDARLRGGVSLRNGRLWVTHSGGLPASGTRDRTAVFWYELNPVSAAAPIVQSGVIDGGAGVHHFFSSIVANANNDVAIGFSRGDATKYVEAVFTGRESTDAAGSVGAITVCKLGEDSYVKDFGGPRVRWGDYSATVVDPTDDLTIWTLQEYAETDVGPNPNDDRWGTWWCKVDWVGGDYSSVTTGNWHTGGTWDIGSVPSITDAVTVTSGTTVTVNSNAQCRDLLIENGGTLVIPDGVTLSVQDTLINNGTMRQTINTVPAASTTSFLHIQDAAGLQDNYFGVDMLPSGAMSNVTVQVRGNRECTTLNEPGDTVNRCFDITASGTAAVTFYYLESERDGLTAANMAAWRWGGSAWSLAGTPGVPGSDGMYYHWVPTTGVSSFSPFVLTDSSVTAPTRVTLQDANTGVDQMKLIIVVALPVSLLGLGALVWARRRRRAS